jgi:peptide/nickel transport system substrate-binding protein
MESSQWRPAECCRRAFAFQIVVASRQQERIALAWQRMLRVIGVQMDIRQIDSAQFQRRLNSYDFDMIPFTWYNSLSPGNEQSFYWGTAGRTQEGTRNYMGADDPAIDKMIAELLAARDRASFEDAARGLDRCCWRDITCCSCSMRRVSGLPGGTR